MTDKKAKVKIGVVTGISQDKTATVRIDSVKTHPLYKKKFVISKKFAIHDEKNECEIGNKVEITETRPISKNKTFKLHSIIKG